MRTVILGGGFGGLACARRLRSLVPREHEVVVVERTPAFVVGAAQTWVMLGERSADEVTHSRAGLAAQGIELVQTEISALDPAALAVHTAAGRLTADFLVIALGAELDMGAVPGLAEAAHTFYTLDGARRLRAALDAFDGGDLLVLIPRAPFKCPPGPYEGAMLLGDLFRRRGIRDRVRLSLTTVEPAPMPTAGPEMGALIRAEVEKRGIAYAPLRKTAAVDPARRVVRFEDGAEQRYDLLVAIPPHVAPRSVRDAGLCGPSGWIPADPRTLATSTPGVWAIGDVAAVPLPGRFKPDMPLALPKAGVFAEQQGRVVAEQIAAAILGSGGGAAFDGKGHCFIESGAGEAMRADGDFFGQPAPRMAAQPASTALLEAKRAWVRSVVASLLG